MNEKQARQAGYVYHGAYSHNKEEMKEKAKQLREAGNKAIVVDSPSSKYSRGGRCMGYSVYWIESEANIAHRKEIARAEKINKLMNEMDACKARIKEIDAELLELS